MNTSKCSRPIVVFGNWGPPFLAFARSCFAQGISVHLLENANEVSNWRRFSSCLAGATCIRPEMVGTESGIQQACECVNGLQASGLIALSDKHLIWLAEHRSSFEPDCKLLTSSAGALKTLLSKRKQIALAENAGFQLLDTWYLTDALDVKQIPLPEYPIVVRPDNQDSAVAPTFKVKFCESPSALELLIRELKNIHEPLIAQPFRRGPNLVVHGVRSVSGETVFSAFMAHRKFEGLTLSLRRTGMNEALENSCRQLVNQINVQGCFHFDLLYSPSDSQVYFLEINPRLGGTTDKVTMAGFDEPMHTLAAFGICGRAEPSEIRSSRTIVNKKSVLKHIVASVRGRISELDYPPGRVTGILRSACDLIFARDSVLSLNDLKGTIWFYGHNLLSH